MFQIAANPVGGLDGGGGKEAYGFWTITLDDGTLQVWTNTNPDSDSVRQVSSIENYYNMQGKSIHQMVFVDGGYSIWETPRDAKFYKAKINSKDPKIKNNLIIAADNYDAAITAAETFGTTKSVSNKELTFMGSIK